MHLHGPDIDGLNTNQFSLPIPSLAISPNPFASHTIEACGFKRMETILYNEQVGIKYVMHARL